MSKPTAEVKNRWKAKAYDSINLTVPKGERAEIQAEAQRRGLSTNRFILNSIHDAMKEKDV